MSLYGVLRSGVSGMNAQSNKLGTVAENIQNSSTTGYKRASTEFSSLILPSSEGNYNSGSVTSRVRYTIAGCTSELSDVRAEDKSTRTIAIEAEDPAAVVSAVASIGLGGVLAFRHLLDTGTFLAVAWLVLSGSGGRRWAVAALALVTAAHLDVTSPVAGAGKRSVVTPVGAIESGCRTTSSSAGGV